MAPTSWVEINLCSIRKVPATWIVLNSSNTCSRHNLEREVVLNSIQAVQVWITAAWWTTTSTTMTNWEVEISKTTISKSNKVNSEASHQIRYPILRSKQWRETDLNQLLENPNIKSQITKINNLTPQWEAKQAKTQHHQIQVLIQRIPSALASDEMKNQIKHQFKWFLLKLLQMHFFKY